MPEIDFEGNEYRAEYKKTAAQEYEDLRKKLIKDLNMREKGNKFTHINRLRQADASDYMTTGIGYVFMTKPHLHLYNNKDIQDNFLQFIADSPLTDSLGKPTLNSLIIGSLDGAYGHSAVGNSPLKDTKFIPIITSSAESFETKDNILKTRETGENFLGNKIIYGDIQTESLGADTFNIEYTEYSDGALFLLHKTWVDYMHAIKRNKIRPYRRTRSYDDPSLAEQAGMEQYGGMGTDRDYVREKILDYACSVYYFLLDPDGTTIRYWCKYTGVFPTSIPYSAMSFNLGENKLRKLNIQYQYSYKNDMDPYTLEEFAYLTRGANVDDVEIKQMIGLDQHFYNTWRSTVGISPDRKKLIFFNK